MWHLSGAVQQYCNIDIGNRPSAPDNCNMNSPFCINYFDINPLKVASQTQYGHFVDMQYFIAFVAYI